jgi:hypothetical protein
LFSARWLDLESRNGHLDRIFFVCCDNCPEMFGAVAA